MRQILHGPRLQPKLTVGPPDDAYEREADRVAKAVMRVPESGQRPPGVCTDCADRMLRQPAEATEEEPYREAPEPIGISSAPIEEEARTKAASSAGPETRPDLQPDVDALSGRPLTGAVKSSMENAFGRDFSGVRIADDPRGADLCRRLQARAVTYERTISFAGGEYQPHLAAGRRLLAHELTHVVQQGGAGSLGRRDRRSSPVAAPASLAPLRLQRALAEAFDAFTLSCPCGEDLGNNCAHFLSNALINAGYDELDGGVGGLYRRRGGRLVCRHGRPVRAAELRAWFAEQASATNSGEPDDSNYWAVYQRRATDGQGHVVLHHHTTGAGYTSAGTGNYPTWATQDHYQW